MTTSISTRIITSRLAATSTMPEATSKQKVALDQIRTRVERPLLWLMLLAVSLRIWAALTPGFHHPDAIYQYLEPAHRLLTGEGVITWEWRVGMRSWLLPALLAVPLGIGEAFDPNGALPMILPRLATAAASLGIVWAAWDIGRRHSATTGLLAGFVAATWFEIVFFAAETLAEPLGVAAVIPAAALVTAPTFTNRRIVLAGALLGFAALARPHYAPAGAAMLLVSWWSSLAPSRFDLRRWGLLVGGALIIAAASAIVDASRGLIPFAWILENFQQNIVHNASARYGTFPLLSYVAWFMEVWHWWLVPAIVGLRFGWRQAPGLLAAAAVTLVLHSLIPHKEYRFVLLAFAAITLIAALGWGETIALARERFGARTGRHVTIAVFAMWALASIGLAQGTLAPTRLAPNIDGWRTFAALRRDPAVCGVALVMPTSFANLPGAVALRRGTPISMFWTGDPAAGGRRPWAAAMTQTATFNRIVTLTNRPLSVPSGYRVTHCEQRWTNRMCILARAGACTGAEASPFLINRVMARTGF
jgi:phosphatidylinositol glycan class B